MIIISHRGYWLEDSEKNSIPAFKRSFSKGWGIETDVRDIAGKLVISHDPPKGNELSLDGFLELMPDSKIPLAINIKADGLAYAIQKTMKRHNHGNYFVFDMSIPDTRVQFQAGNPVYMRMSEVERDPPYLERAAGIWLDAFESEEWQMETLKKTSKENKKICLVSSELHKRNHLLFWQKLKEEGAEKIDHLMLCTDLPEDATTFFGVS